MKLRDVEDFVVVAGIPPEFKITRRFDQLVFECAACNKYAVGFSFILITPQSRERIRAELWEHSKACLQAPAQPWEGGEYARA